MTRQRKSRILDALVRVRKVEHQAEQQKLVNALDVRRDAEQRFQAAKIQNAEALLYREHCSGAGTLIDVTRYANALHHSAETGKQLQARAESFQSAVQEHDAAVTATLGSRKKLDITKRRAQADTQRFAQDLEQATNQDAIDRWLGWGGHDDQN